MSENQKKIWITGASSGIGKALAEKFSLEGWKVAISARRKEILDEMAKREKAAMEDNQDPLVRLKQQEIDLKAAEMNMKGEAEDNKIMANIGIEAEKLDLERDKLKSGMQQTIVKEGFNAIKESNQETIDEIKENMQTLREDKKLRSAEKVASMNARSRSNGRADKNNK